MKVVFLETEKWDCDILQRLCCAHEVIFTEEVLNEKTTQMYKDADIISPFFYLELDRSILTQIEQLKSSFIRSTGFDQIDLQYCLASKCAPLERQGRAGSDHGATDSARRMRRANGALR